MDAPRWLADEMLGRLARYLRFLGFDVAYARARSDAEISEWAAREGRVLLTRDRALSAQVRGTVLIVSPDLDEQLRSVQRAFPDLAFRVEFTRCTECNGLLEPAIASTGLGPRETASGRAPAGTPLYRCPSCGHTYWEGSHTAQVRERVRRALGGP